MKRLGAGSRNRVTITLNGREAQGWAEPRMLLSDFLRHELGATGTHVGCEHGVCGACTVRLDGAPARACLTLAVQAEGRRVDTVEGLAPAGELNDLQKAFRRHHALQCGFCTAGILMSLDAWLESRPAPDEGRGPGAAQRPSLPLHRLLGDRRGGAGRRRSAAARGQPVTDLGRTADRGGGAEPRALAVVDGERRFDYAAWLDTAARLAAGTRRPRARAAATGSPSSCRTVGRWRRCTGPVSLLASSWCRSTGGAALRNSITSSRIRARRPWPSMRLPQQRSPARPTLPNYAALRSAMRPAARSILATCWPHRRRPRLVRARMTSRSCSTPPAPPGAARACRAPIAPSAPRRSPTSHRTATARVSAHSASCRSTTPWACARCSRWCRWAAPSSASTASMRPARFG